MAIERRTGLKWARLMALLIVSGCAVSKEARVRQSLTEAGVPPAVAACMAKPMSEDLTTKQLLALSDAAGMARTPGQMTIEQALKALRTVGDPEVIGVLSAAAFSCIGKVG